MCTKMSLIWTFTLLILFALSFASRHIVDEFKTGQIDVDQILTGFLITRLTDKSYMDCLQECKYRFRCQSVNYLWSFHLCELNYKDTDDGQGIETRPGSVFTSVSQWTDIEDHPCRIENGLSDEDLQLSVIICTDDLIYIEITDCGFPPLVSNAAVLQSNGIGIFSRVVFTCKEGFFPNHYDAEISCMENGTWTNTEFRCIKICDPGQEDRGDGCQDCKAGTYSDTVGTEPCQDCLAGTYQNKTGQTSCELCPLGTWMRYEGQTSCWNCYEGTYMNDTGATNCYKCPDDHYQDASRQTHCLLCSKHDNPCGQPYKIEHSNLTVAPSTDGKYCLATYQCQGLKQGSLLEDEVSVACRRYENEFNWIEPNFDCHDSPLTQKVPGKPYPCQTWLRMHIIHKYTYYCENIYDEGSWTIIQQRFSERNSSSFDKTYAEYEEGFGPTMDEDYWIGNKALSELTKVANELVIFVWNNENRQLTARYATFRVQPENFTLHIAGYEADKSDLVDCLQYANGSIFFTKDEDSRWNCSTTQESGWWFNVERSGYTHCQYCGNVNNLFRSQTYRKSRMMIKKMGHSFFV